LLTALRSFKSLTISKYNCVGGELKIWICGCEKNPYSVEWLRYEKDCPFPELVKTVAHVAFAVDDMDKAIAGKNVIIEPYYPHESVRIAFMASSRHSRSQSLTLLSRYVKIG